MSGEDRITVLLWVIAICLGAIVFNLQGCGLENLDAPYCEEPEPQVQYILQGQPSYDARSTVQLWLRDKGYCSANMIGPHTIITARHCFRDVESAFIDIPEYGFMNLTGWEVNEHVDLAVGYVGHELPGPFINVPEELPACYSWLRVQGFGRDEDGNAGTLNERYIQEIGHTHRYIYTGESICFGDSGSCLVARGTDGQEYCIGITARVVSGDCRSVKRQDWTAAFTNVVHPLHSEWVRERVR